MVDRSYRWLRVASAGFLIAALAGCAGTATGVNADGPVPGPPTTPAGSEVAASVRLLQMNLCNSGIAACYAGGRSIDEAAAVIRSETPDLVTLNEVCEGDVSALEGVLAGAVPGAEVASAFQAARDRDTGDAYRCRNGQPFGNGIVSRWPSVPGSPAGSGIYPVQDPEDPEERAWVCMEVAATPAVGVCTTHLAYTDRDVTMGQCRYLFGTVVAGMRAPLVLGGDLNLGSDDGADLRSCLPSDSVSADDGDVQVVAATPEFVVADSRTIDLRGASDHPGLLVTLAPR
ncbi:endonuclease/exonuclease/phosphatase family protein [Pseudonocardia adelaidensis]|uniref:Endonuclease/exonuclease/phosphatase domain-containing protein n=1 Tax=Pseudonocardia adelaidensis TaxID=648754 RepID=A0ABP9NWJ0_9PSEU